MNVENLSVSVPENYNPEKPIEIVIREGQADPIKLKKKILLIVALASVAEYVFKRNVPSPVKDNPGIITYSKDPEKAFLEYFENPNDEDATVIKSKLEVHPDFSAFGINQGLMFNQKQLQNHIRKFAHCFATEEQAKTLIKDLQNFEVRYEQTVAREDNRQGQTKDLVESAIKFAKGEVPKELHLRIPFFKNTPAKEFTVEVEIDKGAGNMPVFSFYSLEVELLKRATAEELIGTELEKFREGFPVLEM